MPDPGGVPQGLDEKKDVSREEYLEDRDLQDIVERRFEKAIQASLDVASHIVSVEGYRDSENRRFSSIELNL